MFVSEFISLLLRDQTLCCDISVIKTIENNDLIIINNCKNKNENDCDLKVKLTKMICYSTN